MSNHKIRNADDLSWCLLSEKEIINIDSHFKNSNNPLIQITHKTDSPQSIINIEIYAHNDKKTHLKEISELRLEGITTKFVQHSNNYNYDIQLSINFEAGCLKDLITNTIENLFSILLITGRPLRYFNCTFFLPLDLILDSELKMEANEANIKIKNNDNIERYKVIPPASLLQLKEGIQTTENIAHAQAYEYFHTNIQEQLFETEHEESAKNHSKINPIIHHRLKHEITHDLTLKLQDEDKTTSAQIEDVSMYEYYNGLFLLGIRIGLPENTYHQEINAACWVDEKDKEKKLEAESPFYNLICNDKKWWEVLVYGNEETWEILHNLQVEYWLRYTKLVRILYANFFEQLTEQKIAPITLHNKGKELQQSRVKDPFSNIILYFITQFLDVKKEELTRNKRLKHIADERMFTHASYVLAGTAPKAETTAKSEFERLFSYALYVDQKTDGYDIANGWAYDKDYIQTLMKTQTIKRWESISSLSGYTDYSSIFMGFTGYFQNPTATVHVPYIYAKMQIQILFYKLTLEHFNRRTSLATEKLMTAGVKSTEFSELRRSLINFTNEYWFRELTPQIQGKEIAAMMMKQQALTEKYDLIKDKLDRASEYSTTLQDFWLQEKAVFVGWIAAFLAVIAIFPTLIESYTDSGKQIIGLSIVAAIISATVAIFSWKSLRLLYKFIKRKVVKDECIRK